MVFGLYVAQLDIDMRWRGVGGLMLLGAKGPPLPTIKNGLETLKKASSHRVPWSCMVLGCLGWCWCLDSGHIKATQGNAQEGEEGAR
jgi:hypothetical protein